MGWNQRGAASEPVTPEYKTHMLQPNTVETGDETGAAYVQEDVALWTAAFPDLPLDRRRNGRARKFSLRTLAMDEDPSRRVPRPGSRRS